MDVVKDDMQRLGEDPRDRVRWRQMIDCIRKKTSAS